MYAIYILKSIKNGQIYIGFTKDINRRISEHNKGLNKSTKGFRPYKLVYSITTESRKEARAIEKKFKSGYYRERIKRYVAG